MLAVFIRFIESHANETESQEILEELMNLRADFLIQHALSGFDIDYDEALEMLRNAEGLNDGQSAKRNIIVAAVDNLIDFAVAEEYQMARELPSFDDEEFDEDDYEEIFEKYNKRYAEVENSDAEYAMIIAAGLINVADSTMLTYMTQGDERVRPWHLQYEGFTAPKSQFPAWLIPPIEHQCRCYLAEDNIVGVEKFNRKEDKQKLQQGRTSLKERLSTKQCEVSEKQGRDPQDQNKVKKNSREM